MSTIKTFTDETNSLGNSRAGIKVAVTPLEKRIMSFGEQTYNDFSRYRFAEEREWYEMGLFFQRRQWLSWNEGHRRWDIQKPDKKKPRPMPVSNYFAKTINANANALGAQLPSLLATPMDDEPSTRRAANMAERAKDALDIESGMDILCPLLAKHTALWGIGVTKDVYDLSMSNGMTRVNLPVLTQTTHLGCIDCMGEYDIGPEPTLDAQGNAVCPQCGSGTTVTYPVKTISSVEQHVYSKGKLVTEVIPIFDIFLPRDCRNANLAPRVLQRSRIPVGKLERHYPDKAGAIQPDSQEDVHEVYSIALKSLVNYNYMQEQTQPCCTVTEVWAYWEELSTEVKEALQQEFASQPQLVEAMMERGIYAIYGSGMVFDWGVNPLYDEDTGKSYFPYTFFLWEYDPANVYPKSCGTDLVPLQKRLNRLDSLIELAFMCNAAGKWLWPKTQTTAAPTGSPNEVIEYDAIGTGKEKPEFVQPQPTSMQVWTLRAQILNDFNALGLTEAVTTGNTPSGAPGAGGVTAFRALAYLGSKAAEQINTQRRLWELGHELRYKKILLMAKIYWDEPRRVKVAGSTGKFRAFQITGKDLRGAYDIELVPDSTRPKTVQDKQVVLAALLQAGLVNVADPSVRDYILDTVGENAINLIGHRQYEKAERILDAVQNGENPMQIPGLIVPSIDWSIVFMIFNEYTLTEEYEQQDPVVQARIAQFLATVQLKLAEIQLQAAGQPLPPGAPQSGLPGGTPPAPPTPAPTAQGVGNALMGHAQHQQRHPANVMNAVPGQSVPPQQAEQGAQGEAANLSKQLP